VLEAHLFEISGELYDEEVALTFVKRLRDEMAFASPAELSAQIARDVEESRRAL
jgi:riboflavin kinase/FMN adenylyltransferase